VPLEIIPEVEEVLPTVPTDIVKVEEVLPTVPTDIVKTVTEPAPFSFTPTPDAAKEEATLVPPSGSYYEETLDYLDWDSPAESKEGFFEGWEC
jgi:hypothetical protein